jgi:hypothetical protein
MTYPSILDIKWLVQSNQIKDCPVTAQDVNVALKIWGPGVALLKGKTVRYMPPVVVQDIIEAPKEIRKNHKCVTLMVDIFCQQGSLLRHSQFADLLSFGDAHDQPKNYYNLQSS